MDDLESLFEVLAVMLKVEGTKRIDGETTLDGRYFNFTVYRVEIDAVEYTRVDIKGAGG